MGGAFQPALCHMLDVGIVARELLVALPSRLQRVILSQFGAAGANGLAFLSALHDIGKISPGFQSKREDLCGALKQAGFDFPKHVESKHAKVAACCLPDILAAGFGCPEDSAIVLSHVLAAHHGVFVSAGQALAGGKLWDEARSSIARSLADAFQVDTLETAAFASSTEALLFAGLLTMADWLGSSEIHFPFCGSDVLDLQGYLSERAGRAWNLIRELRMDSLVAAERPFTELFPFAPNPCQQAVVKVASSLRHPMLIVVESPMGTGKTEAAQAAYARLAARDHLRGMYCALPTQATGNAMFGRMKSFLERLDLSGQAELHLLHTNADLNAEYEALRLANIDDPKERTEASVVASSWFTSRKRAILANYGTGTVDQALLAVLKVRHFFLRLFGLSGKLLVLDEVHAYDAYMSEEIDKLIGWMRYCDSSVILLSATLPQCRRHKMLQAFAPGWEAPNTLRYPCIIGVDGNGKVELEEIRGLDESHVLMVPVICSQEEKAGRIMNLLADKLTGGGCAACILNTVSEAQRVYDLAKREITDANDLILFHSRFTLERKLEIENQILSRYGAKGKRPWKGIVVSTQVLEQSLDLDFDFMVSDLAPIDLLLQRAGRLHRHRNHRPPLLKDRTLYVLMPDILAGATDLGGSRFVYFPDMLLKTAVLFTENGEYRSLAVALPYGVSSLIESVYGQKDPFVSPDLQKAFDKWAEERSGKEMASRYTAREAALADVHAFLEDPAWYLQNLANDHDDERVFSSRLTRPNITLVIMEERDSLAVQSKEDARRFYAKSLVTDNRHLVRHFSNHEIPREWEEVALLRHCRPLVLQQGRAEIGGRIVAYERDFGLRVLDKKETE
jgi:CRISPR-associated endonuclease/helicase Cas3